MASKKTLDHLVYDIYETINVNADDTEISYDWLAELIVDRRVRWLTNEQNKNRSIDPDAIQSISCLEIQYVDSAECCDTTTGCKVKRSKDKIPPTVKLHHKKLFTSISPVGVVGNLPFTYIERDAARFYGEGPFEKNTIGVFYHNNYLYFISKDLQMFPLLEKVRVEGVFEDPRALADLTDCSGKACWTYASEFPVGRQMWNWMKEDIISRDIKIKLGTPQDLDSNNADDKLPPNTVEEQRR